MNFDKLKEISINQQRIEICSIRMFNILCSVFYVLEKCKRKRVLNADFIYEYVNRIDAVKR